MQIKSTQVKSNKESNDYISDLQDNKTGFKNDADSLFDQDLTAPVIILSACSQNDSSSNGKRKL